MSEITLSVRAAPPAGLAPPRADVSSRNSASAMAAMFEVLLDEVDYPLVVSDGEGHVVFRNHAAHSLLGPMVDTLAFDGAFGTPVVASDQVRLRAALRDAVVLDRRSMLPLGPASNQRCVAVVPIECAGNRWALLMGERDQVCEELSLQSFARAHGVTLAESRVLAALARGESPSSIARAQGVAISTVRTQIQALRMKVGNDTIRALLGRVARLPPLVSVLRRGVAAQAT